MHHTLGGIAPQQLQCVLMRLTVVNDHGQVKLLSESKLPPKELLLQLSGRKIIVIIKPYLTYRNAFIIAAEQL